MAGYLMKCGSKRRIWRKRWFVLSGTKLVYSGSHMETKVHREIPLGDVLDAFEYDVGALEADEGGFGFKVVTTGRALVLCAPSEAEEIRWVSAVRALVARRSGRRTSGGAD
jgi:pleckstrin homology domain-containing family A member 1/2